METTFLGRTGLRVSRLCLGTMNFGSHTTEKDSFDIMSAALDQGINFFDSADVYGGNETERIIGRWFAQDSSHREKVVIATKVYGGSDSWPNKTRLSARHIIEGCTASLERLQTDYIDLYQMHHVDRNTPWEEIWQAMELLVSQGKVLYVGSSNFAGWHIAQANSIATSRNFMGLVSEQSLYNLNARTVELEVIPACREFGLGLIPWSPLAGGLLGGHQGGKDKHDRRASKEMQAKVSKHSQQIHEYATLCHKLGQDEATVALAWLLHNPVVTAPIIGPRTMNQFVSSLPALEADLDDELLKKLDEIWPGPGGEAPEAYAW
ncbi:aldo/keto reductase [Candidatus Neomarinimicrobiota bacterium]